MLKFVHKLQSSYLLSYGAALPSSLLRGPSSPTFGYAAPWLIKARREMMTVLTVFRSRRPNSFTCTPYMYGELDFACLPVRVRPTACTSKCLPVGGSVPSCGRHLVRWSAPTAPFYSSHERSPCSEWYAYVHTHTCIHTVNCR